MNHSPEVRLLTEARLLEMLDGEGTDDLFNQAIDSALEARGLNLPGIVIAVKADGAFWPPRPAAPAAVVILWIGGDEENPPPALADGDFWIRDVVL